MKKLVILPLFLLTFSFSFSQSVNDDIEILRDMAAAERRALVAENLMLSEEESKLFWPIYDDFRADMKKLDSEKMKNIELFASKYENMSDEDANKIMENYHSYEMEYSKLRHSYKNKFTKVLPAKLIFRFFQIENKVDAMIRFALAAEIPLIIKE